MTDDWRAFRPAIWLAMLGIAVFALLNVLVGVALIGGALGVGLRIQRRRTRGRPRGRGR